MLSAVLVVEPYADLRSGIVSALERRSFVCDAVATPGDAALKLREHDYAYVVIDVDTEEETDAFVASLSPDSNVILLTDDDAGASEHHLRKPFSREELLAQFVR